MSYVPPRTPDRDIEQLYARFADFYDHTLCVELAYRAPGLLVEAIDAELGAAGALHVLELGCGTGLAGRHLRARASRLVGIDLSPEMIARARTTGCYDVLDVAEITAWLARSARAEFDLVAACDTLIHFGDLRQVTVPAARRIRPGGWLVFTVERSETLPVRSTDSGRYAHSAGHVTEAAGQAGLVVASVSDGVLRSEHGEPVMGLVVVLRRPRAGRGVARERWPAQMW